MLGRELQSGHGGGRFKVDHEHRQVTLARGHSDVAAYDVGAATQPLRALPRSAKRVLARTGDNQGAHARVVVAPGADEVDLDKTAAPAPSPRRYSTPVGSVSPKSSPKIPFHAATASSTFPA